MAISNEHIKTVRLAIYWLTIAFIVTAVFALTIGQALPILGAIRKKYSKGRNWTIVVSTVLSAILCFFILVRVMFSIGFGEWTNEAILYRNKTDKNISINQQIFEVGAFGYGGHRIAHLTPF